MTSRSRANSKRNEIVSAALRLFADRGIKGTTVRDIAAEAGVTEGALYRHFASKHELAGELFHEAARLLYEHLSDAVQGVVGAHQRLCALAGAFFAFAEQQPEAYGYVMARHHEDVGSLPPGQPLPKDVFVDVIAAGVRAGELRAVDPALGAAMMIGICIRSIFFSERGMIQEDRDTVIREVCRAVHAIFAVEGCDCD